jgi:hypothetical protein
MRTLPHGIEAKSLATSILPDRSSAWGTTGAYLCSSSLDQSFYLQYTRVTFALAVFLSSFQLFEVAVFQKAHRPI